MHSATQPAPDDFAHQTLEAGGLRFHVASAGDPASDSLALCLHGFPECWYSWRHQMPLLAELGYRVWAPDLRGYGGSEIPRGVGAYSLEVLMSDVRALIQASGCRRTLLLAHDWGGIIAWYFAMRHPELLDRLVIYNAPHPGPFAERFSWRQALKSWYVLFFQLPWLPEWMLTRRRAELVGRAFSESAVHKEHFPEEVLEVYRESALRPGAATGMVNYYRALIRGGGARRQQALGLPAIETPTLLCWGEQDIALEKSGNEGLERWVRDLTVHYLPEASHWVQQDQPELANEILHAWLGGEESSGTAVA